MGRFPDEPRHGQRSRRHDLPTASATAPDRLGAALTRFAAVIICTVAIGTNVHFDKAVVAESGLLNASKLGWQLLYILPVAIVFNSATSALSPFFPG
jgi:hypothetical protein